MPITILTESSLTKKGTVWIEYPGDRDHATITKVIEDHPGLPALWKWVEDEVAKLMVRPGTPITPGVQEAARTLEQAPISTGSVQGTPPASPKPDAETEARAVGVVQSLEKVEDRFSPE